MCASPCGFTCRCFGVALTKDLGCEALSTSLSTRSFANTWAKSLTRRKTAEHANTGAVMHAVSQSECRKLTVAYIWTFAWPCDFRSYFRFLLFTVCLLFFRSYALEKRMQYILPLGDSTASMAIDATLMGNVARFLNHSCAPNVYKVACVTPVLVLKINTVLACIFGS